MKVPFPETELQGQRVVYRILVVAYDNYGRTVGWYIVTVDVIYFAVIYIIMYNIYIAED